MRVTTKTNIAVRTLMFCAVNANRTVRKSEIAKACNASENHLAQVINLLAQKGYLVTRRGRGGGLELGREPEDIAVGQVFRDVEEGAPFAECFNPKTNTCPLIDCCKLRLAFERALDAFFDELDSVSLTDLVSDNRQLESLLSMANGIASRNAADCAAPAN
ncbi:MAG: Rrf2 family transcriptional regulator [Hyphomicrobiaceae bacterium]|nr:Rrf2 family transcriptional regulator [Hyphomicrobiaceae bacterium]